MDLKTADRTGDQGMSQLPRFVVTGTGRSGTVYMSRLLTSVGIACSHEAVFHPEGKPEWGRHRGDASWLAVPYLDVFDGYVLHVVRDPLAVVNSYVGIGFFDHDYDHSHDRWRAFAEHHAPNVFTLDDPVTRAMAWYVEWNRRIEPHADRRIRIEDLTGDDLVDLAQKIGKSLSLDELPDAIASVPTNLNSRERAVLTLDDLPEGEYLDGLTEIAIDYGYAFSR